MRVLFIGGTGFISTAVSRQAITKGFELYLLNRGSTPASLPGSHSLTADIHKLEGVRLALQDLEYDVVVDWIAYAPNDIERDLALFQQFGYSLFVRSYHRRFTRLLQRVGHRRRLHNCFADSLSILAKHPVDRPDAQLVYKIGSSYAFVIFHRSHLLKNLTTFLSPTFSTKWPL